MLQTEKRFLILLLSLRRSVLNLKTKTVRPLVKILLGCSARSRVPRQRCSSRRRRLEPCQRRCTPPQTLVTSVLLLSITPILHPLSAVTQTLWCIDCFCAFSQTVRLNEMRLSNIKNSVMRLVRVRLKQRRQSGLLSNTNRLNTCRSTLVENLTPLFLEFRSGAFT